jgi:hypothetical protein
MLYASRFKGTGRHQTTLIGMIWMDSQYVVHWEKYSSSPRSPDQPCMQRLNRTRSTRFPVLHGPARRTSLTSA